MKKTVSLFSYLSSEEEIKINFEIVKHCISVFDFDEVLIVCKSPKADLSKFESLGAKIIEDDLDSSYESYNFFMLNRLCKHVKTDFVLTIQNDGFIINPSAWLDEYLEYDYIGSPWYNPINQKEFRVGNGGFSLRSRKLLQICGRLTDSFKDFSQIGNEDLFICKHLRILLRDFYKIKFAPLELAAKFGVEWNECPEHISVDMNDISTYNTFGFHGRSHVPLIYSEILKMKTLEHSYNKYKLTTDSGGGDKGTVHDYIGIYSKYINPEKCKSLLEIGVHKGYSIKMWEDFLPESNIVGIDINLSQVEFEFVKAKLIEQDATSSSLLESLADETFDVIIDDGSHQTNHQIKSFELLYPKLNSGGYYFIEDVIAGDQEKELLSFLEDLNVEYEVFRPIEKSGRYDDIIFLVFK